ncbi:MAG: 50S ribosomal protein L34e [Candidatus Woesearchaeota archaeon]
MVEGRRRSRTLRRIFVRTPGGRNVVHYAERKKSRPHCSSCGAELHGIKAVAPREMHAMPKTQKRPERPYGGVLCSACMRRVIIQKARQ